MSCEQYDKWFSDEKRNVTHERKQKILFNNNNYQQQKQEEIFNNEKRMFQYNQQQTTDNYLSSLSITNSYINQNNVK